MSYDIIRDRQFPAVIVFKFVVEGEVGCVHTTSPVDILKA